MAEERKKIIVCGGAGFIGSFVTDRLVQKDYDVVVFDHFSSGKMKNIQQHTDKKNFEFIVAEATNRDSINEHIKSAYAMVDLIGIGDLGKSVANPLLYHDINLTATLNLLNACVKNKINNFIFTSSGAVYKSDVPSPIKETHETLPESPYAANKLAAEIYCETFQKVYGINTTVFRFFNVYGPRREHSLYGGAVMNFMQSMMKDEEIKIFGEGTDVRDYVYVKDIAKAVEAALESGATGIYNVGTGKGTSTMELANIVGKVLGKTPKIQKLEKRKGDTPSRVADITKITKNMGYKPDYDLEKGLVEIKEYLTNSK